MATHREDITRENIYFHLISLVYMTVAFYVATVAIVYMKWFLFKEKHPSG